MADHPGQAFVLTDLVKALKLSRATCHALLTGLVEVGYLYRTGDKSYVLGPALAAIGRTAALHLSPLQVAQPEMRRLADDYDLICTAYVLEGDAVVVRERAASASHFGYLGPLGTRLKLRPQSAAVFLAWQAEKQFRAWLESQNPPLTELQLEDMRRGIAFAREHGFVAIVRLSGDGAGNAEPVLGTENREALVALAGELASGRPHALASLVAPVFQADGKVAFAIGLAGFPPSIEHDEAMEIAKHLTSACDRISAFVGGKHGRADDMRVQEATRA